MFEMLCLILLGLIWKYFLNMLSNPKPATTIVYGVIGLFIFFLGFSQFKDSWRSQHVYQANNCLVKKKIMDTPSVILTDSSQKNSAPLEILCPKVVVSYLINDQAYEKSIPLECANTQAGETTILDAYTVGQVTPCFIDPEDYSNVIFSREAISFVSYLLMTIGLSLSGWVAYHYCYPRASNLVSSERIAINPNVINENPDSNLTHTPLISGLNPSQENVYQNGMVKNPYAAFAIISLFTAALILLTYYLLNQEWRVNHYFQQTTCTILDKKLNTSGGSRATYSPSFFVSYTVNQQPITQWISPKINGGGSNMLGVETEILNSYEKDHQYPCWYDPDMPSIVVLNRSHSLAIYLLIFMGIMSVLVLAQFFNRKIRPNL